MRWSSRRARVIACLAGIVTLLAGALGLHLALGRSVAQAASGPAVAVSVPGDDAAVVQTGGSTTFGVWLTAQPASNVTVSVSVTGGDSSVSVAGGSSLTFTPATFNTEQKVTVASAAGATSGSSAVVTASATSFASGTVSVLELASITTHDQRFLQQYATIKDPHSGYFSPLGIPYHSVETLIVEAPDYGHETSSETFSYWLWMEASYGQLTGLWQPFNDAWATMEKYAIPSASDQPNTGFYNPSSPATYGPEFPQPDQYPSALNSSAPSGQDPLASELQSTYGTSTMYSPAWLLDTDNKYGFGHCGDGTTAPAFINTFQRGPEESVWETVPQPECETFKWGAGANGGYLPLFITGSTPAQQWRYTDAPDADARMIQAAYWAGQWAGAQGKASQISGTLAKAAQLGDYLRYSLFDKYFKQIGNCTNAITCPGATGRNSETYLLGWYYAWGACLQSGCGWSWRIGDAEDAQGYQNPLAAWAMSTDSALEPKSPTAPGDWATSLQRQLQFFQWLQSAEGGIAGGATNMWGGNYGTPPSGDPTFYGMFYDFQPVYHDPPSNNWFGYQAWAMERVAEYYFATGDATAKAVLDKWVPWASANTSVTSTGFSIPSNLTWSGQPVTWNPSSPAANTNLHVTVASSGNDIGVAAALAKTLMYYAARSGSSAAKTLAGQLIDSMWANDQDSIGLSTPETRTDYSRFTQAYSSTTHEGLFVPSTFNGVMPNGDPVNSSSNTFLSIRSWYKNDPAWPQVQAYLNGGAAPSFTYHRFWAESDIAMANSVWAQLFESASGPTPSPTPSPTGPPSPSPTPTPSPSPSPTPGSGVSVQVQYANGDTNPTDNQQHPHLQVVNTGKTAVDLSKLTLRYWYTVNEPSNPSIAETFWCDYAVIGCGNVSGSFTQLSSPLTGADHVLTVSFGSGAGTLQPGASSGEIQGRFAKADWSAFNGANDYSWGTVTAFTAWSHVTAYYQGQLVWGMEP